MVGALIAKSLRRDEHVLGIGISENASVAEEASDRDKTVRRIIGQTAASYGFNSIQFVPAREREKWRDI